MPATRTVTLCLPIWFAVAISAPVVCAQPRPTQPVPATSTAGARDLAKATQNPVADLVSIPFQFSFDNGGALEDRTRLTINLQPVLPIHVGDKVNLIVRPILPITLTGPGDIQQQLFFTPSRPGKLVFGVGPVFSFPTSTARALRTGSWAAGPDLVLVATPGPFVLVRTTQDLNSWSEVTTQEASEWRMRRSRTSSSSSGMTSACGTSHVTAAA